MEDPYFLLFISFVQFLPLIPVLLEKEEQETPDLERWQYIEYKEL